MPAVTIVVVDDHPVVREGVAAVLTQDGDLRVVGEAEDGARALRVIADAPPNVVIVDVRLPDVSGIEVCRQIVTRHPDVRVMLMSAQSDELTIAAGFAAGAAGYVLKTAEPHVIRDAVRMVAAGGIFLDPAIAERRAAVRGDRPAGKGPFGLTRQELRVLEHLPRGLTNKGIGAALSIAEDTVKTHIRRILFKLDAHDRAEAVAIAIRAGVL